jgi:hypothetical protein
MIFLDGWNGEFKTHTYRRVCWVMGGRIKDFSYFKLSFLFRFSLEFHNCDRTGCCWFRGGVCFFSLSLTGIEKKTKLKTKNKTWITCLFFTTSPTLLFCLVPPPPLWLCMELMMMQHFIHDKMGEKKKKRSSCVWNVRVVRLLFQFFID